MQCFEEVLIQYEPMIQSMVRKLNIYRDHEHYKQAGRVALWSAWERFDQTKGHFTPFAYRSIRGAMLDELKQENRFSESCIAVEEELWDTMTAQTEYSLWSSEMEDLIDQLSADEQQLIYSLYVEEITHAEFAGRIGITVAGVKKRRERLLKKMKLLLEERKN